MVLVVGVLILFAFILTTNVWRLKGYIMTRSAIFQTSLAYLAFVLCGILIIIGFLWFISLGNWKDWPPTTNYYYQLANAFQEGHLYLDTKASPVLLALPDPYEPDARQNAKGLDLQELDKIWDMSLYKEKVYLYWGPVPAVFLVIIKFFYSGEIGDQYLTFLFISGLVVFQSLFIFRIWRRFFNELSPWIVMPTLLLVAFIHPIPSMLSLPRIYEAAIASDQFFFIGGLYFVFSGLDRPAISAWRLTLAGTFWAFAFGSRIIMALPISFLSVMVILWVLSKKRSGMTAPQKFKALAGLIIPMLVVAVSLGWYNFVRFDSVFEFGFRYAITMLNQRKFYSVLFSTSYIFPNLYVYLFNPPSFTGVFPFFRQIWNEEFISNFNNYYHTIYNAERIAGIIYSAPFLLFALISGFFTWGSDFISDMGRRRKETRLGENEDRQRLFDFLLISLIGALVLEFLTVLLVFYATMRYFMDVIPTLVLLSVIGFWRAYQKFGKRSISKYLYTITAVFLIILSIVISILFAFSSDPARIRSYNPGLLPHLRLFFTYLLKTLGK